MIPRGIRNNNPLNIKYVERNNWKGRVPKTAKRDKVFEEFKTMEYGIRATIKLIRKYIRDGYDTPSKIIDRWCPPIAENDNSNEAYHQYVDSTLRNHAGVELCENDVIKEDDMLKIYELMRAMAMMESRYDLGWSIFMRSLTPDPSPKGALGPKGRFHQAERLKELGV